MMRREEEMMRKEEERGGERRREEERGKQEHWDERETVALEFAVVGMITSRQDVSQP